MGFGTRIGRVWVYETEQALAPREPGAPCFQLVVENGAVMLGCWALRTARARPVMGDFSVLYERQS
jgi:hypothetical protein